MRQRDSQVPNYAAMIYNGFWYAPERELMQKLIDESQQPVTGTARLKLYKGGCIVAGRRAPQGLYRPEFATFEREEVYDQQDATGFIRLNSLRLRIKALAERGR
jgi:argininosuccinate synthase